VTFITDQFFWARQLEKRGIAPRAVRHSRLTAESLTSAMRLALNDAAMRKRAADMAVLVRGEDGTGRAADSIESRDVTGYR
jgi:sterol 3beta-glucosyltransferase